MIPRRYLVLIVVVLAADLAAGALAMRHLPERVPVHYNLAGQADGYGPRWELALLFPLISVGLAGLLVVLPVLGPFRANLESFRITYARIVAVVIVAMAAIHGIILAKALGAPVDIGRALGVAVGLMLAILGNWFGKLRRNFWVGIRTPWTLANDQVWFRTHRLGGKLFVIVGLGAVFAGLLAPPVVAFGVIVGGAVLASVWTLVYSYVVYRRLGGIDDLSPPTTLPPAPTAHR